MTAEKAIMGLDIGSSWVRAAVGTISKDGMLTVESLCERESAGVHNGIVVNAEQTFKTIRSVIQEAQLQAGIEVASCSVGIGGNTVKSYQSEGVTGISAKGQEITKSDIYKSLEVARTLNLEPDSSIIHTLVQDFTVDGRRGIKDPENMTGHRLESNALIVTASANNCANIKKIVNKAGIENVHIVSSVLSDAESVLSLDDKEMGTILINVGSDCTNLIAYHNGSPQFVGAVNMGSSDITNDIAVITNKPRQIVEELKCQYGSCYVANVKDSEEVIIPKVSGLPAIKMPRKEFAKMIEPKMAEIFAYLITGVNPKVMERPFGGGVVLTGGGALLSGITDLVSEMLNMQVRIGFPEMITGLDRSYIGPAYTTILGLLKSEAKRGAYQSVKGEPVQSASKNRNGLFHKIGNFFKTVV